MQWLLNLPGAPLLYYGDEYGQWGGADPNNRMMWRAESDLSVDETATLTFIRNLGTARKNVPALRRGEYISLYVTEDTLVFGRKMASGDAAVVGLSRNATPHVGEHRGDDQARFDLRHAAHGSPRRAVGDRFGSWPAVVRHPSQRGGGAGALTPSEPLDNP